MSFFVWSLSECKLDGDGHAAAVATVHGHCIVSAASICGARLVQCNRRVLCCGGGRLRRGRCLWILLFIDLLCVEVDVLALPGFGRRWVVMIIRCKKLIYL